VAALHRADVPLGLLDGGKFLLACHIKIVCHVFAIVFIGYTYANDLL
jgi:hypothetical protein